MKEKITIVLLIIVLGILISIFASKETVENTIQLDEESNKEAVEVMAVMENDMAVKEYVNHLISLSQNQSCSDEYLAENIDEATKNQSDSDIIQFAKEDEPEYTQLYQDMYATEITPMLPESNKKIAYLTFDDGPSFVTTQILDILDERGIKATFFILGSTITDEGEECLKRMVEDGHTIGIHTYSHKQKVIYSSVESYLEDFYQVYQQVYDITGQKVNIFRFPWGSYNSYSKKIKDDLIKEMERRGFTYYDWNVSAEDSVGKPTAYSIKHNILKDIERYQSPVILMHDASVNKLTARTLPDILDAITELGYEFGTLDDREPCQFFY